MIQAAQDLLATSLSNSADFRTFVGAANAAAALDSIFHDYLPDPDGDTYTQDELDAIFPCALIFTRPETGWVYQRDAAGTNNWGSSGVLVIVLYRDFPTAMSRSEADVDCREKAGDIIEDLRDLSETGGLAATRFTCSGPFRTQEDEIAELGDRQAFEIHVEWGNRL